jgi:hypothetical protein
MSYSRRFIIASIMSMALHVLMLWLGHRAAEAKPKPIYEEAKRVPLTFNLEPEILSEPEQNNPVKRLIATPIPTTEDVEETDLISDNDSKAQDESDVDGERVAPHVDEPDDHDRIEQAPTVEQQEILEQMESIEALQPKSEPNVQESPTEAVEEIEEVTPETAQSAPTLIEVADATEMTSEEEESDEFSEEMLEEVEPIEEKKEAVEDVTPEEQELPESFQIARAEPQPPHPLEQEFSTSRGRAGGGASQSGVMNFEAKSHELGEYMLEVRKRVERQWHTAIQLRYLGVKRAEAVIECVIRPSGIIEEVRIVEPGNSMPFAILCRDAIRNAGPFQQLPFDVPEIYRSQNIEIRWRFSYL